jgi:hypothetical protein
MIFLNFKSVPEENKSFFDNPFFQKASRNLNKSRSFFDYAFIEKSSRFSINLRRKFWRLCSRRSIMIYAKRCSERPIWPRLALWQDAPEPIAYALRET